MPADYDPYDPTGRCQLPVIDPEGMDVTPRPLRRRYTAGALLTTALLTASLGLAGCGGSADTGASKASPTGSTATPTAPGSAEPTEETEPAGDDALEFFRSTETACDGSGGLPHEYFTDAKVSKSLGGDRWLITDGAGRNLIVDLAQRTIYSAEGPEGLLPTEYEFGCPPDLYVAPAHD